MSPALKKWKSSSASQLKTYARCERKWWLEKIAGLPVPTHPAAALGTKIHTEIEEYLLGTGELESDIARAGLEFLPDRSENLLIEERMVLEAKRMPVPIRGIIDLVELDNRRITDHKTTSNFRWAKNEYELLADPQAIIYVMYAHTKWFKGDDPIRFRHIYYRTKGAAASREVEVEFTPQVLFERFADIRGDVKKMSRCAKIKTAREVNPNIDACGDFGGCPFRDECAAMGTFENIGWKDQLFKSGKSKDQKGDSKVDMLAKINKNRDQQSKLPAAFSEKLEASASMARQREGINPPDGTPMDEELPPPKTKGVPGGNRYTKTPPVTELHAPVSKLVEERQKIADKPKGRPRSGPQLPDGRNYKRLNKMDLYAAYFEQFSMLSKSQFSAWASVSLIKDTVLAHLEDNTVRLPRAAEIKTDLGIVLGILQDVKEPVTLSAAEADMQDKVADYHIRNKLPGAAHSEVVESAAEFSEQYSSESKYKADCHAGVEDEGADKEQATERRAEFNKASANDQGYDLHEVEEDDDDGVLAVSKPVATLYIDCMPLRGGAGETIYLHDLLAPYQEAVANSNDVDFYGLVEYGKGPKQVAAMVRLALHEGALSLPEQLVCSKDSPCTESVLEVLKPMYPRIIVGMG